MMRRSGLVHGLVETVDEGFPSSGEGAVDPPPVFVRTSTTDEASFFEAVDKPGDRRLRVHHSVPDRHDREGRHERP